jgi:hypothetical protein
LARDLCRIHAESRVVGCSITEHPYFIRTVYWYEIPAVCRRATAQSVCPSGVKQRRASNPRALGDRKLGESSPESAKDQLRPTFMWLAPSGGSGIGATGRRMGPIGRGSAGLAATIINQHRCSRPDVKTGCSRSIPPISGKPPPLGRSRRATAGPGSASASSRFCTSVQTCVVRLIPLCLTLFCTSRGGTLARLKSDFLIKIREA